MMTLNIENLHVSVEGTEILKGVSLELEPGELQAVMGPNGSGKSTLAHVLVGHPDFEVTSGTMEYNGQDLAELEPDERAKLGLFLGFQYPKEVPGVTVSNFLRTALESRGEELSVPDFMDLLREKMDKLDIDEGFAHRYLNEGFSGGEKKRMEILQMAVLEPEIAILDEVDSGLDIDALKVVANGINQLRTADRGFLLITHYQRILDYVEPDEVHVMMDGRIVRSGGPELAEELEEKGYEDLPISA